MWVMGIEVSVSSCLGNSLGNELLGDETWEADLCVNKHGCGSTSMYG